MSRPTLSTLCSNYNHGRYLRQSVEAVVNQSRRPDQFVIIDDGSTDNSRSILEELTRAHPWIDYHSNDRNLGAMTNAERLVRMVHGDYFYFGAADDFISPGFFEKAMEMARRFPNAGVIFGKVAFYHPSGILKQVDEVVAWRDPQYVAPERFIPEYFDREIVTHSLSAATIYRRKAFEEVGGFHYQLQSWVDTFTIRALMLRHGGCYIPEVFSSARLTPSSLSGQVHRSPARYLDVVFRAAALMRSERYRPLFPEDHARSWLERYRWRIVLSNVKASLLARRPLEALSQLRWIAYRPAES